MSLLADHFRRRAKPGCAPSSTPSGSLLLWRSSRTRPTRPFNSSSSRAAVFAPSRPARSCRRTFSICDRAISAGGERGLLGLAFAPDYATSGRFFVNFTNPSRQHGRSRGSGASRATRSSPTLRRASICGSAACRFICAAVREPQRRQPGVRSRRLSLHRAGRRRHRQRSRASRTEPGGAARQDAAHRRQRRRQRSATAIAVPPDNPFSPGRLRRRAAGNLGVRPAQSVAVHVRRSRARRHRRADHRRRRPERVRRDRLRARGRGGRNYGWRNREGAHDNVTDATAGVLAADRSDLRIRPRTLGQSVTGGFVYRGTALGPAYVGRYFFADFVAGRVWSFGLSIDGNGEAAASGLVEHTAELGGTAALGNVSSFGVDSGGELFVLNYSAGRVLRIVNPAVPPPTPDGTQDHSMIDAAFRRELARAVGPGGLVERSDRPADLRIRRARAPARRSGRGRAAGQRRGSAGGRPALSPPPACRSSRAATARGCRAARCRIQTAC